jgi:trk system potassium uptake protein
MIDVRPVGFICGILLCVLAAVMLLPMLADLVTGSPHWQVFVESAAITFVCGASMALACANSTGRGLTLHQSFLLATSVWVLLPLFGALPFMFGAPGASFTDAFFEAMSGMTTTGSTVFERLETLPAGTLLWRSLLQWLGGLGIIIVALIFLPVMKVGGMQFFRSEAFDTLGKVLPRATDISLALVEIYLVLTLACAVAYWIFGMPAFDAVNHALSTVATGGFATSDASFAAYSAGPQYAGVVFMLLAGLPFIRYIQLAQGSISPLWRDLQVRAYLRWTTYIVGAIVAYRLAQGDALSEDLFRDVLFNTVSLFSGTGFGSADVGAWGTFALVMLMVAGFIGACTASTGCSVKVFRYLILLEAIRTEVRRLHSPHLVRPVRYDGRPVAPDVIAAVIVFFTLFLATFAVLAVALSLTGLEMRTAVTAAWTAIGNIGPAFGSEVSASGAMTAFPEAAKWLMIFGMLLGRLELLSVLVLFLPRFWRS